MNRLRIGVLDSDYFIPQAGGTFYFEQHLLREIDRYQFDPSIEIIFLCLNEEKSRAYQKKTLLVSIKEIDTIKHLLLKDQPKSFNTSPDIKKNPLLKLPYWVFGKFKSARIESVLKKNKIDIIYYPTPDRNVLNYPFITNHWDIAHKSTFAFPESYQFNLNIETEYYYRNILSRALVILCESNAGKSELEHFYSFAPDKVKVMHTFASNIIGLTISAEEQSSILSRYNLNRLKYFLYPAQFWSFKNHYNLIQAFSAFLTEEISYKLVLTGSDKGNMKYIKKIVYSLNLENNVLFTDFVSQEALYSLYSNAAALIMPTFVGPTNMPLLEAAYLKCPILCSDLKGHREMLGDHAIYFDPKNKDDIKNGMYKILNTSFRADMLESAYKHIINSPFNIQNALSELNNILMDLIPIRKTWE